MRLIDADKIRYRDMSDGHVPNGLWYTFLDDVEKVPTVKAIPIEWIEKWLDKTTGTRDGEDISQLPEQLKFAIEMINLMEMEWEKENGKGEEEK